MLTLALLAVSTSELTPEYLVRGFLDSRERLRAGVFTATGSLTDRSAAAGTLTGPVHLFSAFDRDRDLFRFDRTEATRCGRDGQPTGDRAGWTVCQHGAKYARTPVKSATWSTRDPKATVVRPADGEFNRLVRPFDVRVVGLGNQMALERFTRLEPYCQAVLRNLGGATVSEPSSDRLRVRSEDRVAVRHYDFDRTGHGLPVRCEELRRVRDRPGEWQVWEWATTRWEKRRGVWVPVEMASQTGPDGGDHTRYQLTLNWDKVNEPPDDALFQVHGLGLPTGTAIADQKSDTRGVPLGTVGDLQPDPRLLTIETLPPPKPIWPRWLWPAVAVAVVAALAGGLVVRRRLRSR